MLQDAKALFADDLAHDGTATVVDLRTTGAGPGKPIMVNVQGTSLAGATGIMVDTGATSSPTTDLLEIDITSAKLNAGFTFALPETVLRYVTLSLVGTTSAGTWTAGIVVGGGQTNM